MATSPALSEFLYKSCIDAIDKYKAGEESDDKLLELCKWLTSFRSNGYITDAQLRELSNRLEVEVDVPDAPDTYEAEINKVKQGLQSLNDGVAELSEIVSDQGESQEITDTGLAELSEIVSRLVPTE